MFLYAAGFALLALWAARRYRQAELLRIARISLLLLPLSLVLGIQAARPGHPARRHDLRRTLLPAGQRHVAAPAAAGAPVFPSSPITRGWARGWPVPLELVHPGRRAGRRYVHRRRRTRAQSAHPSARRVRLFAPLLVVIVGGRWWLGFVRQPWSPAHWWIAAVLLVEAVHNASNTRCGTPFSSASPRSCWAPRATPPARPSARQSAVAHGRPSR